MLRRLLVSILGFLALCLGTALPAVGAADLPTHPEPVHAYAHDGDSATAPYGTAIERGPPTIVYAGRHAVGSSSCGVLACPAGSNLPSAYGFDHPDEVVRVTYDAGMSWGSVEDIHWDIVDVDHGGVAANTARAESIVAESRTYVDLTRGGSIRNVGTNAMHTEFAETFTQNGWASRVSSDGAVRIFEQNGARYVSRTPGWQLQRVVGGRGW